MSALDIAAVLVREFEGCRLTAYRDQGGVWTIGYGHTGPEVVPGLCWTQAQADAALLADLAAAEKRVSSLVKIALTANQLAALISMAFNVGCNALAGSTLLRLVNAGAWIEAAKVFLAWDHVDGVENRGLLRRRLAEAATFLEGSP